MWNGTLKDLRKQNSTRNTCVRCSKGTVISFQIERYCPTCEYAMSGEESYWNKQQRNVKKQPGENIDLGDFVLEPIDLEDGADEEITVPNIVPPGYTIDIKDIKSGDTHVVTLDVGDAGSFVKGDKVRLSFTDTYSGMRMKEHNSVFMDGNIANGYVRLVHPIGLGGVKAILEKV